jgi:hypothetical protein
MITRIALLAWVFVSATAGEAGDWQHIKDPTTGVQFEFPCAGEPEVVQEEPKVIGYACNRGELFYIAMLVELPGQGEQAARLAWLEQFSTAQFETLRKKAADHGSTFNLKSNEAIEYHGLPARQLTWELAGRTGVVRVVAGKKNGVSLQIASKGPATDQEAKRYFESLALD